MVGKARRKIMEPQTNTNVLRRVTIEARNNLFYCVRWVNWRIKLMRFKTYMSLGIGHEFKRDCWHLKSIHALKPCPYLPWHPLATSEAHRPITSNDLPGLTRLNCYGQYLTLASCKRIYSVNQKVQYHRHQKTHDLAINQAKISILIARYSGIIRNKDRNILRNVFPILYIEKGIAKSH